MKKIAVIIPHYNGESILRDCLESLSKQSSKDFQVYVVDNGSSDQSVKMIENEFPEINIFKSDINLGYSGGCNYGITHSKEQFVLLLNNDTIQNENCIHELLMKIETTEIIAAVQPKLLSFQNKEKFDYSGACGGEIDYLGYPFARGRIFQEIETDKKQYDQLDSQIFWASGTAILLRRSALVKSGLLDDEFFAHMEEIDLCWRLQSLGYQIHVEPKSIVYHYSGYTLEAMNPKKMYLNHRNNLLMLYKNLESSVLFKRMTLRIIFELITIIISLFRLDFSRIIAVLKSLNFFVFHHNKFRKKRDRIQNDRIIHNTDLRIYKKSIILKSFIQKISSYSEIIF